MITKKQVAGMVTLYNSQASVLKNIETYISQIDKLFVIDNSDIISVKWDVIFSSNPKIYYHPNGENKGIAYALNKAAELARQDGYDYLLTMDDDSRVPNELIDKMILFLQAHSDSKIGIASASHSNIETTLKYRIVEYTMTSGNLINLNIHKKVGGFLEELFIDHVDHEYGLRLNKAGYQVVELLELILYHPLGQVKRKPIWSGGGSFISHQPIRMYYIVRNGWFVAKIYPKFRWTATKLITKELIKSFFWENARRERISFIFKGIIDAYNGHMGKLALERNT